MVKRRDWQQDSASSKRPRLDGRNEQRNVACSVFVGQLSLRTTWQNLKDHMRKAGNVDSVRLCVSVLCSQHPSHNFKTC